MIYPFLYAIFILPISWSTFQEVLSLGIFEHNSGISIKSCASKFLEIGVLHSMITDKHKNQEKRDEVSVTC